MAKLEFYGTGKDGRLTKSMQNFPPMMASPDQSSSLEQRNQLDRNFKAEIKSQFDNQIYKDNFKQNNDTYSLNKKFYQSHYESLKSKSQPYEVVKQQINGSPFHSSTLKLFNNKIYAESPRSNQGTQSNFGSRVQSLNSIRNSNTNNSNFQGQFSNLASPNVSTIQNSNNSNVKGNIERDHFYVTRPLLRINKDFVEKPLIKNVQVVSDDLPNWCQTTNKYYTPENIDKSKKQKIVIKKNQDIFGNDIQTYPNNFKFFCEPPSKGQRFEKNRMVIADRQEEAKKTLTKKELMLGKLRIKWDEDVKKQKYEPLLPLKIGHDNETPYIKKLEQKRNQSLNEFRKVGEVDRFRLESKDKPVQLKIGHGTPEIINPIKFSLA